MAGKNQITGGSFQDFEGNTLANGYLTMKLSHDEQETVDPGEVVSGYALKVPLDTNGNVAGTVLIWPNDQLNPANSYYVVNAYRNTGVLAWSAPQYWAITSSPSPFNLGSLVPTNPPTSAGAPVGSILLQTNGVNNGSQAKFNAVPGSGITITDDGAGDITFASGTGPSGTGFWVAFGGSATFSSTQQAGGFFLGNNSWTTQTATAAATAPTATTPAALNIRPNTSVGGNGGGVGSGGTYMSNLQSIASLKWKLRINQNTSMRIWMGAVQNLGTAFKNDVLASAFAGFRFSTNAGDTKYQCVTNTGSAQTTTAESTASHVDTNFHIFEIRFISPNVTFYIDGQLVGSQSTNLPSAATLLGYQAYIDNVGVVGQPSFDLSAVLTNSNF